MGVGVGLYTRGLKVNLLDNFDDLIKRLGKHNVERLDEEYNVYSRVAVYRITDINLVVGVNEEREIIQLELYKLTEDSCALIESKTKKIYSSGRTFICETKDSGEKKELDLTRSKYCASHGSYGDVQCRNIRVENRLCKGNKGMSCDRCEDMVEGVLELCLRLNNKLYRINRKLYKDKIDSIEVSTHNMIDFIL